MARQAVLERARRSSPALPETTLEIPEHPELPEAAYRQVVAQHEAVRTQEGARLAERHDRVAAAVKAARARKESLVGARREDIRALVREERARAMEALTPPRGLRTTARELRDAATARRARFADYLGELGVDRTAIAAEGRRASREWRDAAGPAPDLAGYGPATTPDLQALSHDSDALHFTPPHAVGTWLVHKQVKSDDFLFTGFFLNDGADRVLGHVNQTEIWDDVDDFESSFATMRSLFGFWLDLPQGTQKVKIYVQAEPISTFHAYFLEDEWWGESNSHVFQNTSLFSELIGVNGGVQAAKGLSFMSGPATIDDDESEGSKQQHFYAGAPAAWFEWTSDVPEMTPPPNGSSVFAWIGLQTTNDHFVDDVVGLSGVTSRWRFLDILVEPLT